jgi:hypothetical protein
LVLGHFGISTIVHGSFWTRRGSYLNVHRISRFKRKCSKIVFYRFKRQGNIFFKRTLAKSLVIFKNEKWLSLKPISSLLNES